MNGKREIQKIQKVGWIFPRIILVDVRIVAEELWYRKDPPPPIYIHPCRSSHNYSIFIIVRESGIVSAIMEGLVYTAEMPKKLEP